MIAGLFKDMSKYLPANIIPALVGIITIPVVTRLFPPGEYGNYVLVWATVSVLGVIVGWLPMAVIRFFPAYERDSRLGEFYGTVLSLATLSIGIVFLIFLGLIYLCKNLISRDLYLLMRIGSLVFVINAFFEILAYLLRIKRRAGWYSTFFAWKSIASLSLGLVLILLLGLGVEGLLWGVVFSTALTFPFLWKVALGKPLAEIRRFSLPLSSSMAKYGFPLAAGNLAAWILSLSDRYILEFFRGTHEVGIYSVSYDISSKTVLLILTLFALASGPIEMNIWERQGEQASQEFLTKLTRSYILICIPAVVGLSALARPIITILTAHEYYEGYRIIHLVTAGAFFLGLQQRYQSGLLFYKKTYYVTFSILASGLLNLCLNLLFIPKYGYFAAAATTFLSYGFLLAIIIVISRRFFVWNFPFQTLARVIIASTVMAVIVYRVGNSLTSSTCANLIMATCIGMMVYFLILLVTKEFSREEIRSLSLYRKKVFT
ncbi:MAG: lipopolysaccharide biosynthesis protein [Candidatus Hodarchaeota archaeon]